MSELPFSLRLKNIPLYVYTTFCLSVNRHLGSFHLWAIVNTMNSQYCYEYECTNTSLRLCFQCWTVCTQKWNTGSHSILFLIFFFWGTKKSYYFLQHLLHFTFPPTVHKDSNFSTSLPMIVTFILVLFYSSHPNGCDCISPRFLNEIKEGSQTLPWWKPWRWDSRVNCHIFWHMKTVCVILILSHSTFYLFICGCIRC